MDDENRYPRWAVLLGVVVYCAVAWAIVFQVGGAATDVIAGWIDGSVTHQAAVTVDATRP